MKLDYSHELNNPQIEAVKTIHGPVLIIAGAGSGKTRVITYRIAYMLDSGIPQHSILALTFTNKAAREMETRVKELTGKKLQNLTVSTFHAFGVKILRKEIEILGFRNNFSIYDEGDREDLIKETLHECKMGSDKTSLYGLGPLFSNIKTGRYTWRNAPGIVGASGTSLHASSYERVYNEYQNSLKIYNALDFDDLLVLPITIFENHPEILAKYRERYQYIMVDEFQDTSLIQYHLMRLLALGKEEQNNALVHKSANVCVVGDDDQSIYSWRGANYENLLRFEKDFPGAKEIKLEQNYRSTTTILEAANGVIAHNTNRKDKTLWSGNSGGKSIELKFPENESAEGAYIAGKIREHMIRESKTYDDFGVLLRTNSLTRAIEESFLESNIPYKVSGGMSFFQRKEIKDILAYQKAIANLNDDVNLLRIINTPRRGIGKNTIQTISEHAKRNKTFFWDSMDRLCRRSGSDSPIAFKTRAEIEIFMNLIESYKEQMLGSAGKKNLADITEKLADEINYWPYLIAEFKNNEKIARWRRSNIEYYIQSIKNWENDPDNFDAGLYAWLNRVSLITSSDDKDEDKGKVNIMTIHAAKGLEFPIVFIAAAEDGIIPHTRSLEEAAQNIDDGKARNSQANSSMEEERRLFYVAITRAREKLYLSSCQQRRRMQDTVECLPSPFLAEIPSHLVSVIDDSKPVHDPDEAEAFFARIKDTFK